MPTRHQDSSCAKRDVVGSSRVCHTRRRKADAGVAACSFPPASALPAASRASALMPRPFAMACKQPMMMAKSSTCTMPLPSVSSSDATKSTSWLARRKPAELRACSTSSISRYPRLCRSIVENQRWYLRRSAVGMACNRRSFSRSRASPVLLDSTFVPPCTADMRAVVAMVSLVFGFQGQARGRRLPLLFRRGAVQSAPARVSRRPCGLKRHVDSHSFSPARVG